MAAEPKRAWWRRKRWIAAAVLLLLGPVSYPGSMAPAAYAIGRGWLDESALEDVYRPMIEVMDAITSAARPSVAVASVTRPDGHIVTAYSRPRISWWAPTAASAVGRYWDFIGRCGEAGIRHRTDGDNRLLKRTRSGAVKS